MDYNEVINSEPVVLVEFYASWCPHCQRMMPVVEQVKPMWNRCLHSSSIATARRCGVTAERWRAKFC